MRKMIRCGLLLFIILMLPAVVINAENVEEVEEGIYQVVEDGEQSYVESGASNEPSVDEPSSGFDNGEDNNSGSGDESTGQEGNNISDEGKTETIEESNGDYQNDEVILKLEIIDNDLIELKITLFKIMISIWVLAGLFIGVKLIKEMFGYG